MPNLKNCERCGKVFAAPGPETLCAECNIADARDLKKVTDYLRENPLASIMDVNKATGIGQKQVLRFINSGSLKMRKQPEAFKCRLCGAPIKKGMMCDKCRARVEEMQKKPGKAGR